MNRQIKFRAWDNKSHRWVYITIGQSIDPYTVSVINEIVISGNQWYQYTGLKDKNGKEIYEGDIVKIKTISTHARRVEYINGSFKYISKNTVAHSIGGYAEDEINIIGNIYENPDLLK